MSARPTRPDERSQPVQACPVSFLRGGAGCPFDSPDNTITGLVLVFQGGGGVLPLSLSVFDARLVRDVLSELIAAAEAYNLSTN